jgi:hypothetical protein
MDTRTAVSPAASIEAGQHAIQLLRQYECGAVPLPRKAADSFHRHLAFDHLVEPDKASMRQRFQAIGRSIRDLLTSEGVETAPRSVSVQPQSLAELVGRQLSDRERDPVFAESIATAQMLAQSLTA